jgi:hypothetical protein
MELGGSGWIRFGQVAEYSTHRMIIGKLIKSNRRKIGVGAWDGNTYVNCDVIFMQRHMEKWVPDLVRSARESGQIIVNDVDDWYWNLHPDNTASVAVDPGRNRNNNINYYSEAIAESSAVTVSTPFIQERLTDGDRQPFLIRNGVNVEAFAVRQHGSRQPVLGWAGSTAHRSGDLDVIRSFANKVQGMEWVHLGHHDAQPSFAEQAGIKPSKLSVIPMLPPSQYCLSFAFDIGVVPLTDHEFNKAKSWIKGLEYAAAGVPFIASPSPEYLHLSNEYGIGRIAATPEEWVHHIGQLSDYKTRADEAHRNLKIVTEMLGARGQTERFDDFVMGLAS